MLIVAHRIELDPIGKQVTQFRRACGIARFAYNWALSLWKEQYAAGQKPSEAALRKQLNAIKGTQFPWMEEASKCVPQQAIKNLGTAFSRFFKKKAKYPVFKKKGHFDSFRADNGPASKTGSAVKFNGNYVILPIYGYVRMKERLRFNGRVLSVVVSRSADRWFASFTVELQDRPIKCKNQAVVGVDLGVRELAVLSDGTRIEGPKALKRNLQKLKRTGRALSRKCKGSKNRQKAKLRLARLHLRISNIRNDALHKLTTTLAERFTVIGIEDLNVRGMMANRKLARAIADVGMYEFRRQLEYKANLYGAKIVLADRFFPSSKKCSACGQIQQKLSLSDRTFNCTYCGVTLDRDLNAALNLKVLAESSSVAVCGEASSGRVKSTKLTSVKQKLSTSLSDQV
jgi:putative transposase